ncbi:hypothetical protein [Chromobacterium violaceum]|uniref:hypothetical protein n=1 Tax=Chromobacterium violaceum TaxID=536 RepID=UPI0005B9F206|nr:hypothetical protein [Chromobacterium violaceum]
MAQLDVTRVILNPRFMDRGLVCERNTQTVGDNGRAVNSTALLPFAGVVTTDNGSFLERLASGQRKKDSITIHTVFALQDGGNGSDADIVQWKGKRYTVTNVKDFGNFGRGFVCAYCDLIPFSG